MTWSHHCSVDIKKPHRSAHILYMYFLNISPTLRTAYLYICFRAPQIQQEPSYLSNPSHAQCLVQPHHMLHSPAKRIQLTSISASTPRRVHHQITKQMLKLQLPNQSQVAHHRRCHRVLSLYTQVNPWTTCSATSHPHLPRGSRSQNPLCSGGTLHQQLQTHSGAIRISPRTLSC